MAVLVVLGGGGVLAWWLTSGDDKGSGAASAASDEADEVAETDEAAAAGGSDDLAAAQAEIAAAVAAQSGGSAGDDEVEPDSGDDAAPVQDPAPAAVAAVPDDAAAALPSAVPGAADALPAPVDDAVAPVDDAVAPADAAVAVAPQPVGDAAPASEGVALDVAVELVMARPVEAGDPLYSSCQQAARVERCFTLVLEPGSTVALDETSLGLQGSALSLVERAHPFEVLAVDGRVHLHVPAHYLFARFDLSDRQGQHYTVLAYTERGLTRKAMALFERTAAEQMSAALGVEAAAEAPPVVPFYGERAELTGDALPEIVVQGAHQANPFGAKMGYALIAGPDAGRAIDVRPVVWPTFGVYRLREQGAMLGVGQLGCEVPDDAPGGMLVLWRLGEEDAPQMFINTTQLSEAGEDIPAAIREAGEALRVVLVTAPDAGGDPVVERVELYASAQACAAGSDPTVLNW